MGVGASVALVTFHTALSASVQSEVPCATCIRAADLQHQVANLAQETPTIADLMAKMADLEEKLASLEQSQEKYRRLSELNDWEFMLDDVKADLRAAMESQWKLLCGALVFVMQIGFAMLETGSVRFKKAVHVLMKNLTDICVATMAWWACGWMFAYGEPAKIPVIGTKNAFANDFYKLSEGTYSVRDSDGDEPLRWFFQWAFCGTAATIVSGGVAERISFTGYLILTFIMAGFIYPVVAFWAWSEHGWLAGEEAEFDTGFFDFAGSGVVHMTGGVAALWGAIIVGPRNNRFQDRRRHEFLPHNINSVVMGTFLLWFGWYGFNCGSTRLATRSEGETAAHVAMNTTIGPAVGGLTVLILGHGVLLWFDWHRDPKDQQQKTRENDKKIAVASICNGILSGLVSITASCSSVETFSAAAIAMIGGCIYLTASELMRRWKIDDPVDAFAIHGCCGTWGCLAAVLFDWGKGFENFNGPEGFDCIRTGDNNDGPCDKDAWLSALGAQISGILAIWLWVSFWTFVVLKPLDKLGLLTHPDSEQVFEPAEPFSFNEVARQANDMPSGDLEQPKATDVGLPDKK